MAPRGIEPRRLRRERSVLPLDYEAFMRQRVQSIKVFLGRHKMTGD